MKSGDMKDQNTTSSYESPAKTTTLVCPPRPLKPSNRQLLFSAKRANKVPREATENTPKIEQAVGHRETTENTPKVNRTVGPKAHLNKVFDAKGTNQASRKRKLLESFNEAEAREDDDHAVSELRKGLEKMCRGSKRMKLR